MILSIALSAVVNLSKNSSLIKHDVSETAKTCAENVSSLLNSECDLDELKTSPQGKIANEAHEVLHELCNSSLMDYVYIYSIDPKESTRYYYLSAGLTRKKDDIALNEFSQYLSPAMSITPEEQELLDGSKEIVSVPRKNKYGNWVTWIAPYYDTNGKFRALIGMNYSVRRLNRNVFMNFLVDIIPFIILLIPSMLFLLVLIQKRIISPIGEISDHMNHFAQDRCKKKESLNIPTDDEIGEIAKSFEKMTDDISNYVSNIEELTRDKLENDVQLDIARRIQYGLVPEERSLDDNGFRISAITRPAKAVGGDFYDFFKLDNGNVCIVIGDVSGKGISAAIFMSVIKTVMREKLKAGISPAQTMNQTNEEIYLHNPEFFFATSFAAILNPTTGELIYANAGHTRSVILKKEPEFLFVDSGVAIGIYDESNLADYTMKLLPGEGILLYTDGATDALNPNRKFFGCDRLLSAAKRALEAKDTTSEIVDSIVNEVNDFCEGNEPFDDMAILALICKENLLKPLPLEFASFDEVKKRVFETAGDSENTRIALVACEEAMTNIINYSGATELLFSCNVKEGLLCVTFSDNGIPFDQTKERAEEKEFELLDSGGMGLNIIRKAVKSMNYQRDKERNMLTLNFAI